MGAIGRIAGDAGDQLAALEAKRDQAQARKRELDRALRDARARADQLDLEALDVEAGVLAGVRTKADLARTRKALDTAADDAGPDADREARVAARACELVDAEISAFIAEHIDELVGGLRDRAIDLEDRLRSSLEAALAAIEDIGAHEGQLLALTGASGRGTRGVVTASDQQRDLRRTIRAALDNGQTRPARVQAEPLTWTLIPPPDDNE